LSGKQLLKGRQPCLESGEEGTNETADLVGDTKPAP